MATCDKTPDNAENQEGIYACKQADDVRRPWRQKENPSWFYPGPTSTTEGSVKTSERSLTLLILAYSVSGYPLLLHAYFPRARVLQRGRHLSLQRKTSTLVMESSNTWGRCQSLLEAIHTQSVCSIWLFALRGPDSLRQVI